MGSSEPLFHLPVGLQKGRDVCARSALLLLSPLFKPPQSWWLPCTTPSTGVSLCHVQFLFLSYPGKLNRMW